jgi:metallophosphoesterase superfamily enzyme
VISSQTYHWGEKVIVPANPTREEDENGTYTFAGWDKEVVACAGDATYIATYTTAAVLLGDVNGDGKINARDARALLRYIAGLVDESEIDLSAADYNHDGRVNARDARAILRFIAGLDE